MDDQIARGTLKKQARRPARPPLLAALVGCCLLSGCFGLGGGGNKKPPQAVAGTGGLSAVALESGRARPQEGSIVLRGSRNETLGFSISINRATAGAAASVRLVDFARDERPADRLMAADASWSQVLPVPVDLNRAGYVRQAGVTAEGEQSLPRAMVPLKPASGRVALSDLKAAPASAAPLIWFDLPIRAETVPGAYTGAVELVAEDGQTVVGRLPVTLTVYDLTLPDRRNLQMLGQISWDQLLRHFPDTFEAVTPKLVNRSDARYAKAVAALDRFVTTAQAHRLAVAVDRLQPAVKWNPPSVDWRDFDGLVGPWLDGTAFPDKEPLGQWPLPTIDFLENYPAAAQRDYLANAAAHFDAKDWLTRAPVWIASTGGRADLGPLRQRLLERAAAVLAAHPRLRVAVPLEADQVRYADASSPTLPARNDEERLISASPGLIYNTQIQAAGPRRGTTFIRTDESGLITNAGAGGDERDVRVWAWLAYVRGAGIIRFDDVLPVTEATQRADPNALTWFYPGSWFGVDGPVPSLQLKWLRRAQQDFEYLTLADARGQRINARLMARLLTRPVQVQPGQATDPIYGLLGGTADQAAWDDGMQLLTKTILLRPPGQEVDPQDQTNLNLETLQWAEPQEKPLVVGRSTLFAPTPDGKVDVRVGVDIYNASDTTPTNNSLGFEQVPRGWTVDPQPQLIPPLATYQVQRFALGAKIDPDALDPRRRTPAALTFTNGYTRRTMPAPLMVPAGVTRRREGNLGIDGSLGDWTDDDALCAGPLVRMLDRPTLQQHSLSNAATNANIYSAWSEANVYVAFKVGGIAPSALQSAQNFVRYDFRRAWGEDIVQLLVQAVYPDGSLGPVLHVACKPNGGQWSERKLDLRESAADAWEPLESGARYSCTLDKGEWRGEVAIPWRALQPANFVAGPDRFPTMLRFNFAQHQQASGASASWAGPVDHGRDDTFTGVLVLRTVEGK